MIPLPQRRNLVDPEDKDMSIVGQCDLLQINRSGLYYKPRSASKLDLRIMREMDELHLMDPTMGTRRMSKELQKLGYTIGRTKVRRLMQVMRMKTIYCHPRTTVIDPAKYKYPYLLRNLQVTRVNQVWAVDITYIPMQHGFMYLVAIIDLKSRYIVGWSVSNSMEAEWVVEMLRVAIKQHGKPEIINSDQGTQFTSDDYIDFVKSKEIRISMDGKGRATDNAYIERFWRTIKYDKIYLAPPTDGVELYTMCDEFIHYYNHRRGHSSLSYDTPGEHFRKAA